MARNAALAPGEFYHVYNRGTEKRDIFMDHADYERFLALLYLANQDKAVILKLQGRTLDEIDCTRETEPLIDIGAYCLMPNHFHILLRERSDGGTSRFMQKVMTGYTMYFNKRYERSGSLFQGTYKVTHVDNNRYLHYLFSYIHLNPIKLIEPAWKETGIEDRDGAQAYLERYPHSSYLDYIGRERPHAVILEREAMPEYFTSATDFKAQLSEWLSYSRLIQG